MEEHRVHCVAFKGFVIFLKQERPRDADLKNSCAKIWLYRYTDQTFVKVEKTLPLGNISDATVLKFECVLDRTSGLIRPCLLVHQLLKKRSGGTEMIFHVLFLSENFESLHPLGCVNVYMNGNIPSEDQIKVFDGPCIFWSSEATVYLVSPDLAGNLALISHLLTELIPNAQPNSFIIHWCGNLNGEVVAMGTTQTVTNGSSGSGKGLSWTFVKLAQGHITAPDTCFVPPAYVSIVTCASVITRLAAFTCGLTSSQKSGSRSIPRMNNVLVFAATNLGQLLVFNDGHLRNCWRLPFVDPCRIWTLEVEYGETMVLVQSKSNRVCAVNSSEHKVAQEWTGIRSVLSEDFLRTGTEQLLLLSNDWSHYQGNDPLSRFILVDIKRGMHTINSKQEFDGQMGSSMETKTASVESGVGSLQRTAEALGARLQAGLSSLTEAQVECNEKFQLIEQSCAVLENVASDNGSGREVPLKSPGQLVCLLDGNFKKGESSCPAPSDVQVMATATWQRVVHDSWVVAVNIMNSGECPLSDLVLALVPQGTEDHITSTCNPAFASDCNFLVCNSVSHSCFNSEDFEPTVITAPASKRPRTCSNTNLGNSAVLLPGNTVTLLATSSLPKFALHPSHSCSLVVTWTSHSKTDHTNHHAMCCGRVVLTVDQIVNGSLGINQGTHGDECNKRNILALKSASMETQLVIQSTISSWLPVASLLQSAMPLPVLEVSTPEVLMDASHLPMRVNSTGPLTGAGMMVHSGQKGLHVRLWTRNKNQVYLIMHKLREILADDAVIHPDQSLCVSHVVTSLSAMDREITALHGSLSKLLQDVNLTTAPGHSVEDRARFDGGINNPATKEGGLQIVRKDFERRQAHGSSVKHDRLVHGNKLAEIWQGALQDQMRTDSRIQRTAGYST